MLSTNKKEIPSEKMPNALADSVIEQQPLLVVLGQSSFSSISFDQFCDKQHLTLFATDSTEQAFDLLSRYSVSLLVASVELVAPDNGEFIRRVKSTFPLLPLLVMSGAHQVADAVTAMKAGAVDCLVAPCSTTDVYNKLSAHLEKRSLKIDGLVVEDKRSRELVHMADRVADSDVTVLLSGKSGTGKEVLSRFIHGRSPRKDAPFIAVNCAAIPENMLESTLFGYNKGSFTGAYKSTPGKFELAQHGTILLDEISEISLELQAKLLRVLQEKEVERLGSNKVIELDVRVLATTNRNLMEEVAAGRFREDLYYRLNVFPLVVPALKDRPMDILPLAHQLIKRHLKPGDNFTGFGNGVEQALLIHHWPGNVRELDNLLQRALILKNGPTIELSDLAFQADAASTPDIEKIEQVSANLQQSLQSVEEQKILDALAAGSRKLAAEQLGISPRTLRYKIARMRDSGISIPR